MTDQLTEHSGSIYQHGPHSSRVYIMKAAAGAEAELIAHVHELAKEKGYGKIIAKIRAAAAPIFIKEGYHIEARIPGFFPPNGEEAVFAALYPDPDRIRTSAERVSHENMVMKLAKEKRSDHLLNPTLPPDYRLKSLLPEDLPRLASLYRRVFPSYPFPIHDIEYLQETMDSHVKYFGIFRGDALAAAASAETDAASRSAEMTDFATDPEQLGRGLALNLLLQMETVMEDEGILNLYTIARAASAAMNITFARAGYRFGGKLLNNTQISGSIESMNVWFKPGIYSERKFR